MNQCCHGRCLLFCTHPATDSLFCNPHAQPRRRTPPPPATATNSIYPASPPHPLSHTPATQANPPPPCHNRGLLELLLAEKNQRDQHPSSPPTSPHAHPTVSIHAAATKSCAGGGSGRPAQGPGQQQGRLGRQQQQQQQLGRGQGLGGGSGQASRRGRDGSASSSGSGPAPLFTPSLRCLALQELPAPGWMATLKSVRGGGPCVAWEAGGACGARQQGPAAAHSPGAAAAWVRVGRVGPERGTCGTCGA